MNHAQHGKDIFKYFNTEVAIQGIGSSLLDDFGNSLSSSVLEPLDKPCHIAQGKPTTRMMT